MDATAAHRRPRWALAVLPFIALAVLVAACGGSTESSDEAATPNGLTPITVGVTSVADVSTLYLGIERGFFKDEGLAVTAEEVSRGAASVPAVVNNEHQFGFSNTVSIMVAAQKGLPLQIVARAGGEVDDPDAKRFTSAVLSKAGSDIRAPKDLEGRTMALNSLESIGALSIRRSLEQRGVDVSTIEFIEIEFPDMGAALDTGRVDAMWNVEPFVTIALRDGAQQIFAPYFETAPGLLTTVWYTSTTYAGENPQIVDGFVRAINRANAYAARHPEAMRQEVGRVADIEPEILKEMILPNTRLGLDETSLDLLATLIAEYEFADGKPNLDEIVRPAAE